MCPITTLGEVYSPLCEANWLWVTSQLRQPIWRKGKQDETFLFQWTTSWDMTKKPLMPPQGLVHIKQHLAMWLPVRINSNLVCLRRAETTPQADCHCWMPNFLQTKEELWNQPTWSPDSCYPWINCKDRSFMVRLQELSKIYPILAAVSILNGECEQQEVCVFLPCLFHVKSLKMDSNTHIEFRRL